MAVTGPAGFSHTSSAGETLSGLAPGVYTIAASGVVIGDDGFTATNPVQRISVVPSATPTRVAVDYQVATARLTVVISGLATNAQALVTVTGPGGYSHPVITGVFAGRIPDAVHLIGPHSATTMHNRYRPGRWRTDASASPP